MKVLFLGHNSFYTVSYLANAILENTEDIEISAADLYKPGGEIISPEELKIFDRVIELPRNRSTKYTGGDKRAEAFNILKDSSRRKVLLKNLLLLKNNSLKNYIKSETVKKKYSVEMKDKLSGYDLYHFHYLSPEYLTPLKYIDKDKKVILSFWGSDLLQTAGKENYVKQLKALERADYITINPGEMKEIFLSKFGRHFQNKLRNMYFIFNENRFNEIEAKKNPETIKIFKHKNQIQEDKIIITIGYNGSSKQKHIEILEILNKLDSSAVEKFHVVIPMTYGLQFEAEDYLEKIKNECGKAKFGTTVITEYMNEEDLVEFTVACEIKINVRDTDSMNASMIESLLAGNILVNGSWLPYGKLRRLGIYYKEIEELKELEKLIPDLLKNFEEEKKKASNNSKIIKEFFSVNNIVGSWAKLYNEIKDNLKQLKN